MIDSFHHITCPFPSFKFSNLPKWKGRYKNNTILAVPGVIIVLHAPHSRDHVLTPEIIARGSTYLCMIYIRSCFSMMTTNSKDRVVLATLISNHNSRLLFPMYEVIIHLFLVCLLLHACSAGKQIALRLRQSSKAGDRNLDILINLPHNFISVMAPKKSGQDNQVRARRDKIT
jgi:hypothetical protein